MSIAARHSSLSVRLGIIISEERYLAQEKGVGAGVWVAVAVVVVVKGEVKSLGARTTPPGLVSRRQPWTQASVELLADKKCVEPDRAVLPTE